MGNSKIIKYQDNVRYAEYLFQFFDKYVSIKESQYTLMIKAFAKTMMTLAFRGVGFSIKRFFNMEIKEKNEIFVPDPILQGKGKSKVRPNIIDVSLSSALTFKEYLNGNRTYKNIKHQQFLPDGTPRKDDKFVEKGTKLWT